MRGGRFYLFATYYTADKSIRRAVQIAVSDTPEGPFVPHSERVTPADWMSPDGTLWVEDGAPYMVFCHERPVILPLQEMDQEPYLQPVK